VGADDNQISRPSVRFLFDETVGAAKRNDLDRVRPPADLVLLIFYVGVCAWLVYQLFQVPHDAGTPTPGFISGRSRCRLL